MTTIISILGVTIALIEVGIAIYKYSKGQQESGEAKRLQYIIKHLTIHIHYETTIKV